MKQVLIMILAAGLPLAAQAQQADAAATAAIASPETASDAAPEIPAIGPFDAADVDLEDFVYIRRPLVVFADSPNDPQYVQQMQLLAMEPALLDERDVVVITDTDPAARSSTRLKLRPRGFSLVLLDKDGTVMLRKPSAWDLREISRAIDKFPLRRQEILEQRPAGR